MRIKGSFREELAEWLVQIDDEANGEAIDTIDVQVHRAGDHVELRCEAIFRDGRFTQTTIEDREAVAA